MSRNAGALRDIPKKTAAEETSFNTKLLLDAHQTESHLILVTFKQRPVFTTTFSPHILKAKDTF